MSDPWHFSALTVARRVAAGLETLPPTGTDRAAARRAAMYAEAIDDDDAGDALFRFGPRLRTVLEALGLAPVADALLLPMPVSSAPPPAEQLAQGSWSDRGAKDLPAA